MANKPNNFVAKYAKATTSGAGAHKDKKKSVKGGEKPKHKKDFKRAEVDESDKKPPNWAKVITKSTHATNPTAGQPPVGKKLTKKEVKKHWYPSRNDPRYNESYEDKLAKALTEAIRRLK
jgi:hypothetical protein